MSDNNLVDGLFYSEPRANAPDFVMGGVSIQKEKLMEWLVTAEVNEKGYVNLDILRSKAGKPYFKLNTWKPDPSKGSASSTTTLPEGVPF